MVTSLTTWLKTIFDQTDPLTQNPDDPTIDQILRNHRVRNPTRAEEMIAFADGDADVDSETGQVTVTLHDLDGTQQYYGHDYTYNFYSGLFNVLVDDVVVNPADYVYSPLSMDLDFHAPLTGTNRTVQVRGHILRLRMAILEYGKMIILGLSTLPSVRDGEFERLASRIERTMNGQYGSRIIRR
jgi:hypothetical protein